MGDKEKTTIRFDTKYEAELYKALGALDLAARDYMLHMRDEKKEQFLNGDFDNEARTITLRIEDLRLAYQACKKTHDISIFDKKYNIDIKESDNPIWELLKKARDIADSEDNHRLSEYLEVGMSYLAEKEDNL